MVFRINKILIIFIAIIICLIFIGLNIFKNIALWLYQRDPIPEKLDVICTFAGDPKREKYALEIYQKYKPILIVSTTNKKKFISLAEKFSVDTNRILLHNKCRSTWDEINFFNQTLHKYRQRYELGEDAIVGFISSYYHMRRIMLVNSIVRRGSFFRYISLPVPIDRYGLSIAVYKNWWQDKINRKIVQSEILKMGSDILSSIPILRPWWFKYKYLILKKEK